VRPSPLSRAVAALVVGAVAAAVASPAAQPPVTWAIVKARVVPVSSAVLESGTVVWRDGRIVAIGAAVAAPADARVIDGTGLTVYPGLIDLGSTAGVDAPATRPEPARTTEDTERAKRAVLVRPQLRAADSLDTAAPALMRAAAAGIATTLALPPAGAIRGQSALVSTGLPEDDPQIGGPADDRRGRAVLRSPVALHVSFPSRPPGGDAYPNSLLGVIAFVRQQLADAQHHHAAVAYAERVKGASPPAYDPAFDALQPALAGRLPVAFHAESGREIRRALDIAAAFKLTPIIIGGLEADRVASDLKAADARVVLGLDFPTRADSLAPEADESLRALRARAGAPRVAAALDAAGVPFAFASDGLEQPRDFVKHAGRAAQGGVSRERILRALTFDAAQIAGVTDRLGSLEAGKLATLVVTDGDLFEDKTTVKHLFIAGAAIKLETARPGQ
jgi:imidazolonepropionase-like amidohydrolase